MKFNLRNLLVLNLLIWIGLITLAVAVIGGCNG